jgi:hypothetical protein
MTHDTTEAVTREIQRLSSDWDEPFTDDEAERIAKAAIEAHNKAMREAVPERELFQLVNPSWEQMRKQANDIGFNEARRLFLGDES